MVFAVPLSLGCAIYISELASPRIKSVLKPATELLAGIPSVVYGFFGMIVLSTFIRITFNIPSGQTWLAGSILLGIMALPTIISVSEDAISSVPCEYREGSLATGATRWQTISRVIVPAALSGIAAAIILGIGRAIGETMAVIMVTGNAAIIPSPIWNVLSSVRTLTGTLGIEMGDVAVGSEHYHALFGVAVVLLIITLIINISALAILSHLRDGRTTGRAKRSWLHFPTLTLVKERFLPWSRIAFLTLLAILFLAGLGWVALIVILAAAAWHYGRNRISRPHIERVAFSCVIAAALAVLAILAIILGYIIVNGLPALSWEFLTQGPTDLGRSGGIFPAIVGTLYLVAGAILIALPLGVGAAVYLVEYTREGRITKLIRTGVDLLNGTPSIVFGLFGFAFLVLFLDVGISLLAGMITLALMVLPTVIRTTEESLKNIPQSLREGSLALGATQWQTIKNVVIPPASTGDRNRGNPLDRQGGRRDRADHVYGSRLLDAVPAHLALPAGDGTSVSPLHPLDQRTGRNDQQVRDRPSPPDAGRGVLHGRDPDQESLCAQGTGIIHVRLNRYSNKKPQPLVQRETCAPEYHHGD